ncbi:SRPBCC family protein [Streptomyces vastus]|uniref:Coenzyme Q-binding protein COQ10 START domain-containing protein n=1 Tax=Streptomyces vastus TaxID=285451 RepID=A0ABP6E5G3_9ACTN
MTDTLGTATGRAKNGLGTATEQTKETTGGGLGGLGGVAGVAQSEAADRLKAELQEYLAAQVQRLLMGFGRKLGETTGKLNDIAEGNSPGFARLALATGRKLAKGKRPLRTAVEVGASRAKEKVLEPLKNLGGGESKSKGRSGQKPTAIMEYVDVGVPLRTAYDQWTQYQEFSTFAQGVQSANRDDEDDTTSDWQLKILWFSRSWKAHITEQRPDDRISWTSEGTKGTTKGVVSFHRLDENLTRVLLVMEYYPTGLFEHTGNICRAQGRRARLDLKHFARYVTLRGEATDGWRGEISDGEVVRSHEDALAEEGEEPEEAEEEEGAYEEEEEEAEEEPEAEYEDEEVPEGEEEEEEPEGEYEEEDEYETAEGGSRR